MQKSDWKKCKLGDVCSSSNTGLDAIRRAPIVEEDTGLKCLRIQDISQHKDFCLWGNTRVSDIDKEKFLIQKDDIFVARTGATVGCNYIVMQNFPAVFNNGLIRLKIKKDIEPLYVFYNLQGAFFRDYIRGIAFGTVAQPNIKIRDLLNFTLNLPPLEEQKRIAKILGLLDDKIELLQKQNKTLEDMAKAIFKSWFVDFDVVHAKQKGLPKADVMREYYLTDELYDLFPSSFENSSLGPIPSGWQVKHITEFIEFEKGIEPGAKNYINISSDEECVPFYRVQDISSYGNQSKTFVNKQLLKGKFFSNDDIMVSLDATLGRVCIGVNGGFSSGIRKIIDKNNTLSKIYILCFLKSDYFLQMLDKYTGAETTIKHAGKAVNYLQIVFDEKIIKQFNQITKDIFPKILQNIKQIQTLTELRDTLLLPLISGKIRV